MNDDESPASALESEEVAIIVAAIDTSSLASRVVEFAARMARRAAWPATQLHILHVRRAASFDCPGHAGLRVEELAEEARSYLEYQVRTARKQCPAPVTGHFAEGEPVERILSLVRSVNADLLVVGTHDAIGIERFLLGSVATKIAKRSPCTVTIVRQKQRPYTKLA